VFSRLSRHNHAIVKDLSFTERESGPRPALVEEVDELTWGGFVGLIRTRVADGSFADAFPVGCSDPGRGVIAADSEQFWSSLRAYVPGLPDRFRAADLPSTPTVMDVLEFAAEHVAQANYGEEHAFFGHFHLEFDRVAGRSDLRRAVNALFRRRGLAFEMDRDGRVRRLAPKVLRERLAGGLPKSGRPSLDNRLRRAIEKYSSPEPADRAEALEKLWDAWEELKTLKGKKPAGVALLIQDAAVHPAYREVLDGDARTLTSVGNEFQIRHTEVGKVALEGSMQVDYFFGRLFNLVWLFLTNITADQPTP
jgi:hypothetical protein